MREGFRAPTIGELFGTLSRFDQTIDDPCSNGSTRRATSPTTRPSGELHRAGRSGRRHLRAGQSADSVITGGNDDLEARNVEELGVRRRLQPVASSRASRSRPIVTRSRSRARSRRSTPRSRSTIASSTTIRASCALVTALASAARSRRSRACSATSPGSRPRASTSTSPTARRKPQLRHVRPDLEQHLPQQLRPDLSRPSTAPDDQPRRHRAGQPDQGFPKWKSIGILDWDWHELRRDADRPLHLAS